MHTRMHRVRGEGWEAPGPMRSSHSLRLGNTTPGKGPEMVKWPCSLLSSGAEGRCLPELAQQGGGLPGAGTRGSRLWVLAPFLSTKLPSSSVDWGAAVMLSCELGSHDSCVCRCGLSAAGEGWAGRLGLGRPGLHPDQPDQPQGPLAPHKASYLPHKVGK